MIGYLHKTWKTNFANKLDLSEDIEDLKNLAGQNNIRLPSSCHLIKTLLKHSVHMSIFHVFKDLTKQVEPVPCPCWPGCRIAHLWLSPTPASPSTALPPPRQQAGKFASIDTIEDIRYWIQDIGHYVGSSKFLLTSPASNFSREASSSPRKARNSASSLVVGIGRDEIHQILREFFC